MILMSDKLLGRADVCLSDCQYRLTQAAECLADAPSGLRMRDWTDEAIRLYAMRETLGGIRHRIQGYRTAEQEREAR